MSELERILQANERYASAFRNGELASAPARRLAIVTCMDARIDPAKAFSLEEGDAHVIRNAGGIVTDDALRSLVVSHTLLGTQEFLVVGHTDCGMATFTNEDLRAMVPEAARADATAIDFLPFDDVAASVEGSVRRVRESPLLPEGLPVSGWIYDVRSGRLDALA